MGVCHVYPYLGGHATPSCEGWPNGAKICCVTPCGLCLMDFMINKRPKRSYHVSSSCQIQDPNCVEFLDVENWDSIFVIFL